MAQDSDGEVDITSLTVVTVAVIVYGLLNRHGFGRALALGAATPVGAAVVVGAIAVPTFYAVSIGAAVGVALRLLESSERPRALPPVPASRTLVLLVVVSILVTLTAPLLFDGLQVLSPAGSGGSLSAGVITKSNGAQIIYLILSVGVVAFLARSSGTGPGIVGTAACLTTLLSLWAWAHVAGGVPYPEGVFDNSPNFVFQNTLPGGAPRVRGILSEPAGLATSCLVTIAYCCSRVRHVSGIRKLGLLAVGGIAVYLGSISTSTTFLVAGVVLALLAVFAGVAGFVVRGGSLSTRSVAVLCTAAVAAVWFLPYIANAVGQQIEAKIGTSSYNDRSYSDDFSYRLVFETFGLGTGLGSNRASSFAASLLSTVGIAGTVLLAAAIYVLVSRSWGVREVRPVVWALLAVLICKVISGPDLSDSSGVLWLSLGVLAHAALNARGRHETPRWSVAVPRPTATAEEERQWRVRSNGE